MANVLVHSGDRQHNDGEQTQRSLEQILEAVQRRAFAIFEQRGGEPGREVGDWLQAERELLKVPVVETQSQEQCVEIKANVEGFAASDIHVFAWPHEIVITARNEAAQGTASETSRSIFCRLALPARIDIDTVKASLSKGVLKIHAPRSDWQSPADVPAKDAASLQTAAA